MIDFAYDTWEKVEKTIYVSFLKVGGYELKKKLIIKIEYLSGGFRLSSDELDICVANIDFEDARDEFIFMFKEDIHNYINGDEALLTNDGIDLRKKYKEYL